MFTARLILRCPGYYVTVYLSLHYLWRYLWQCAVNFRSSSQTKQTNEWEWMALVFLELIRTVHFHSTLYHFTSSSPISYHMYRQTNIHTHRQNRMIRQHDRDGHTLYWLRAFVSWVEFLCHVMMWCSWYKSICVPVESWTIHCMNSHSFIPHLL